MSESVQSRLAQLQEKGRLPQAVAARELALLEGGAAPQEDRSGADLFLTGAALPPTAPLGQHQQAVADGARLAPGFRLLERYEVLALLGVGGMGQVYLVQDHRRGREIAIKALYPSASTPTSEGSWPPGSLVERLRHELAINERLTHPQILRTYDLETDPDARLLFFTMEYIPGVSLAQRLHQQPQQPLDVCLRLLEQIARALDYAHGQGVIHRDVKPSNVLVTGADAVKLLDFGIAMMEAQVQVPAMGTAYYMAPEQLRGEQVSSAADIYALGVLAFQMLTGHVPQPGMPGPSVLRQGDMGAVDGPALDAAVLKAMHWRPEQRFASASGLVDALGRALRSGVSKAVSTMASQERSSTKADPSRRKSIPSDPGDSETAKGIEPVDAPDNVVPLIQEKAGIGRRSPAAIKRLHQRIQRKRPGWLAGELSAPNSVPADASIPLSRSLWALSELPPVPQGQHERILLSRQGIPLASFVYIPPGTFQMGLPEGDAEAMPAETPARQIQLDGYWIARTPITNAAWAVFVQESGYTLPAELRRSYYLRHWPDGPDGSCPDALRDHPVVWLPFPVVWAFCDFYGLSLPSEAQWEYAIRGDERRFPWGDELPATQLAALCNADNQRGGVCAVGMFPEGASPFGVLGGIGNVLEWCADRWQPRLLSDLPVRGGLGDDGGADDPVSPPRKSVDRVAVRGGHYYTDVSRLRATYRQGHPLVQSTAHTSFRPVLDWRK